MKRNKDNEDQREPGAPLEAGSTGEAKPHDQSKKKKHGTRVDYLSGEGEKKLKGRVTGRNDAEDLDTT
jgi:hypothetical protein